MIHQENSVHFVYEPRQMYVFQEAEGCEVHDFPLWEINIRFNITILQSSWVSFSLVQTLHYDPNHV